MSIIICPCKGCADRALHFHSKCEKYTAWASRKEAEYKKRELGRDFLC